ncbi:hypothetical protein [Scatolibacter rhodanostii]|uniref:hypothetical protein n=1 Tax=Scatolibacter rhodanostii TaxID=2014781 RepID=UPI000C06FA02|nr:hypothetical protein [Scatolibacter rhodanostii]
MSADNQKFLEACDTVIGKSPVRTGIGTLGEKTLHAVLKNYFEPYADNHEIKIGSYVADIVSEQGIIEIQTQGFNKLRKKLESFLACTDVTVVYPIAQTKWLCWIDQETGEVTKKRKSPKRGQIYDAFFELYKIKPLLNHPNLHFCFTLLELTEYRYLNGWSANKKKGSSRCDRIPKNLIEECWIHSAYDYSAMIPQNLPDSFTTKDFSQLAKISLRAAQTAMNVLYAVNAVERVGKIGNAYCYQRSNH